MPDGGAPFAHARHHHQAGRLAEAERCYQQALTDDPGHAETLHMLGVVAGQTGRNADAVNLIGRAIAIAGEVAAYHANLGNVLLRQEQPGPAIACYQRAIALDPAFAAAHFNLGVALRKQGQSDEAAACYRQAVALRPGYEQAWGNLAAILIEHEDWPGTEQCCRAILGLRPGDPVALNNLGIALTEQGRLADAEACFRLAATLHPDSADAHNSLGNALKAQDRVDDAADCYRRAIALQPDFAVAHYNLGNALVEQYRPEQAVDSYRRALDLRPDHPAAHTNMGAALAAQGLLGEAADCYSRALNLKPDDLAAHNNLGAALVEQGRVDEAAACFQRAIDFEPNFPCAHLNLAIRKLARGDLAAGWAEYEWRWLTPQMLQGQRRFTQPQWRGEPAAGRTLLIHAEQGFGDTLQFCRYAPLAAARGLRVILEVQPPLARLLRCLPGVDRLVARGEALPDFELHCPMLSLPLAFGTSTPAAIPSAASYLRACPEQAETWRKRLADLPGAILPTQAKRVGLVWAGGIASPGMNRRRSLSPELLAPLCSLPGIQFVSLQKHGPPAPVACNVADVMAAVDDFADTAALVANLDLVIAVDTAVAHLAAALGTPVWLLDRFDPCWRWLTGRRDSPWYPGLRIYRQPRPGDWVAVLDEIARDLQQFAAGGA